MPIYEFYCAGCNTIFSFFSRRICSAPPAPSCPLCKAKELERQVSHFSHPIGSRETAPSPSLLEKAVHSLASEMNGADQEDPRMVGRFMRRFSENTGIELGAGFDEFMARLESGEAPEAIESAMGDYLHDSNPFDIKGPGRAARQEKPRRDDTFYPLEH